MTMSEESRPHWNHETLASYRSSRGFPALRAGDADEVLAILSGATQTLREITVKPETQPVVTFEVAGNGDIT